MYFSPQPFHHLHFPVILQNVHRKCRDGNTSAFVIQLSLSLNSPLTGVSSLHIRVVQLCPGSSPSETLGSERPGRRFAPLAPCPHRAAKCKGKCLCLLLIQHAPTSRAEHAWRNVPFGSPRRTTRENVASNEREKKKCRKAIAGSSVSLYAGCGPAAIADLSAVFGPLGCCHVVWQSSTDMLPECADGVMMQFVKGIEREGLFPLEYI